MSTKSAEADVMHVLDSAINAFGDAMKAGVKAQEEIVRWWSSALDSNGSANPMVDWQKRGRAMFDEAVPAAQKQAEEWMKIVEQNYRRSVELLKKAMDTEEAGAASSLRDKTRKLWEESLSVIKENAESMAQVNVKMMEMWAGVLRKNLEQSEAAYKAAAKSVATAVK